MVSGSRMIGAKSVPARQLRSGAVEELADLGSVAGDRRGSQVGFQIIEPAARLTGLHQADAQVALLLPIIGRELAQPFNDANGPAKVTLAEVNALQVGKHAQHD